MRHGVEEERQPAVSPAQHRANEGLGVARPLTRQLFPDRQGLTSAGQHDAAVGHANAPAEHREGRRVPRVDALEQVGMPREEGAGRRVDAHQAVIQERGLAVGQQGPDQAGRMRAIREESLPDRHRQRKRNQARHAVGRGQRAAVGGASASRASRRRTASVEHRGRAGRRRRPLHPRVEPGARRVGIDALPRRRGVHRSNHFEQQPRAGRLWVETDGCGQLGRGSWQFDGRPWRRALRPRSRLRGGRTCRAQQAQPDQRPRQNLSLGPHRHHDLRSLLPVALSRRPPIADHEG